MDANIIEGLNLENIVVTVNEFSKLTGIKKHSIKKAIEDGRLTRCYKERVKYKTSYILLSEAKDLFGVTPVRNVIKNTRKFNLIQNMLNIKFYPVVQSTEKPQNNDADKNEGKKRDRKDILKSIVDEGIGLDREYIGENSARTVLEIFGMTESDISLKLMKLEKKRVSGLHSGESIQIYKTKDVLYIGKVYLK